MSFFYTNFHIVFSITLLFVLLLGLIVAIQNDIEKQRKVPGHVLSKYPLSQESLFVDDEENALPLGSLLDTDYDPSTWQPLTRVQVARALRHVQEEHDDTKGSITHEESSLEMSASAVVDCPKKLSRLDHYC